jgi:Holliday junction resolvase RusA-like endonuclease
MLPHWNRHLAGEITIEQYRELWRACWNRYLSASENKKHRGNNMDTVSFSFSVPGKPQQKGSKQAFARMGKNGRPFATLVDSNREAMNHQNWIKACALAEVPLDWERDGPIKVSIYFQFERPKSHMLKSGELRKGAPEYHVSKPDIDKLVRTVLDGLTGVLFSRRQSGRNFTFVERLRK